MAAAFGSLYCAYLTQPIHKVKILDELLKRKLIK